MRDTQHAQQEMTEEAFSYDDVVHAPADGDIIENYPQHRRGACCLVYGRTPLDRPIHIVCTNRHWGRRPICLGAPRLSADRWAGAAIWIR